VSLKSVIGFNPRSKLCTTEKLPIR
jgi:hypothetical protein